MASWLPSVFGSKPEGQTVGGDDDKGPSAPPLQTPAAPIRPGFGGGDAWFLVGPLSSLPNIAESGETIISDPCPVPAAAAAATANQNPNEKSTTPPPRPSCKVLQVPRHDSSLALPLPDSAILAAGEQDSAAAMLSYFDPSILSSSSSSSSPPSLPANPPPSASSTRKAAAASLRDQVLVFRYKSTVHAIDNQCPHSSYPLSNGSPFDIEDFGLRLSSGITCPKHGWSFDLFRGNGDRGNYRLKVWEVCVRGKGEGVPSTRKRGGGGGGGGQGQGQGQGQRKEGREGEGEGKEEEEIDEDDLLVWVRRKQRMG